MSAGLDTLEDIARVGAARANRQTVLPSAPDPLVRAERLARAALANLEATAKEADVLAGEVASRDPSAHKDIQRALDIRRALILNCHSLGFVLDGRAA